MTFLSQVDWSCWHPSERGVLCFIFRPGEVLLILKKRGLGAGKINAPGGRIEAGESPFQAAIRETQEEVGLTPHAPCAMGELFFQFTDGYGLHCAVFRSEDFEGELIETDEAAPSWTRLDALPYDAMWADDRHWLPLLVEGRRFRGRFVFDGELMLHHEMELVADDAPFSFE